ncbi:Dabb family protein [Sphingobacterium bambusae]|uniref:Dabb family protein n=1 Tax=Sphingobacterium bambusae TaxID=662858 RepID=A0ABW6BNM7_9SPHI|nr:Dabb family protein [Sphingobacterium bambusae]WPL48109.1 Dabb family protein [Sphingobacterium bambusae]
MKRKDFIQTLGTASVLGLASSKLMAASGIKKTKKVYFHYLLFWLKPGLSETEVADFAQFFEGLKKLPYVKNVRYGKPAASSPRAVLDNSFSYNASMEFDSLEELEAYGKLPAHLALVAKYKPYLEKMMVHDTVFEG